MTQTSEHDLAGALIGIQIAIASGDAVAYAELSATIQSALPGLDREQTNFLIRSSSLVVFTLADKLVELAHQTGHEVLSDALRDIAAKAR